MTTDLRKQLEKLILKDETFEELEIELSQLNVFDAIGMSTQEIRHSSFLAFLLNPSANHSLNDYFLKQFLVEMLSLSNNPDGLSPIEVDVADFSNAKVRTEEPTNFGRIDIFIQIPTGDHNIIVAIENKIYSGETGDQLERYLHFINETYPEDDKYFVFLTPDGIDPSSENVIKHYVTVSYEHIENIIKIVMRKHGTKLSNELMTLMRHYVDMLKNNNIVESDISIKYRELWSGEYRAVLDILKVFYESGVTTVDTNLNELMESLRDSRHQTALNKLISNKPDFREDVADYIETLIGNEFFNLVRKKYWVEISPKNWNYPFVVTTGKESSENPDKVYIQLSFNNLPHILEIRASLGVGPQHIREYFYRALQSGEFNRLRAKLYDNWNAIFAESLIEYGSEQPTVLTDNMRHEIKDSWHNFMDKQFQKFATIIADASNQLSEINQN